MALIHLRNRCVSAVDTARTPVIRNNRITDQTVHNRLRQSGLCSRHPLKGIKLKRLHLIARLQWARARLSNHSFKVSFSDMSNATPYHYTTASKSVGFLYTTISETFPTTTINTHSSVAKFQIKLGFIRQQNVATGTISDRRRSGRPRETTLRQDRHITLIHLRNRFVTAVDTARQIPGIRARAH
jgi:hypothetical protein